MEESSIASTPAKSEHEILLDQPLEFFSYGKLDLDCTITISPQKKFLYNLFPADGTPSARGLRWVAAALNETTPILRDERRDSYQYITAATMYNEGVTELEKTLVGILKNQHVMQDRGYAPHEHLLVILVDGPDKLVADEELQAFLSSLGLFSLEAMDSLREIREESKASDLGYRRKG